MDLMDLTSKLQRGAAKGAQGFLSPQQLRLLARFPRKAIPPTQLFFFFLVLFFLDDVFDCDDAITRGVGFGSAIKGLDETSDSLIVLHD